VVGGGALQDVGLAAPFLAASGIAAAAAVVLAALAGGPA